MKSAFPKALSIVLIFLFVSYVRTNAATCTASTGNWSTVSTWSCGHVPTCGDSLVIPANTDVTVDVQVDLSACASAVQINVFGTLTFATGDKMKLPCGSHVYVQPGGHVNPGNGGGNSNLINICGTDIWTASYGPVSGPTTIQCCNPLPIELIAFDAVQSGPGITISWSTASETNNDYFTLERSMDGNTFSEVARISGAGTSSVTNIYSLSDPDPEDGVNYYRLTQTDFDGSTKSYPLIEAVFDDKNSCELTISTDQNGDLIVGFPNCMLNSSPDLELVDLSGRIVFDVNPQLNDNGGFIYTITHNDKMKTGVYFVKVITNENVYSSEVISR